EGQGFVSYYIRPRAGLATGTEIRGVASIVFDANPAITTNQVDSHDPSKGIDPNKEALVTIDAGPPSSSVSALPATSPPTFTVTWSGDDAAGGSGIDSYDVFVSDNDGPYTPWQHDVTETTAVFGGIADHTYRFYSVARDHVGHVETAPDSADAMTHVSTTTIS